jgi:Rieske Fe-S protein
MPDRRKPKPSRYTADRDIQGAFEGETVTRRRFMVGSVHTAGGIAAAAFTLPALAFAIAPIGKRLPTQWEGIGTPADFDDTHYIPRVINIVPNTGEAGYSTIYVRKRNPQIDTQPEDQYNHFVAMSTRCEHLGCSVRWVDAASRFICPCHGGVYDFRGLRVAGPPVKPLDRFYTRVRSGQVQVGPRFSVNRELRRFEPRDPGQTTDGIGQYLYPPRFTTAAQPNTHK